MLIPFFCTLNILLFLGGLVAFRRGSGERIFTIALVQVLLFLPLLALEYFYFGYKLEPQAVRLLFFSELVFILIWLSLSMRLKQAVQSSLHDHRRSFALEVAVGSILLLSAAYFLATRTVVSMTQSSLAFEMYGLVFFSTLLMLLAVIFTAWRLEEFWRALGSAARWEYKFLVVGALVICGALAWASSYRLTYLKIFPNHLLLLSALLLSGWSLMVYAVVRHRLLNRKIFVSRKVVYSIIVPSLLSVYLLGFGTISILIRAFGLEMSYVLKWLFVILGLLVVGLFGFSAPFRRRAHYFISTHFYINKYEYRDEWLALSRELQGASTEVEVINGLRQVLTRSLYTSEIFIWTGGAAKQPDYALVSSPDKWQVANSKAAIADSDILVRYLHNHTYFHRQEQEPDRAWQKVEDEKSAFFSSFNLQLLVPVVIGSNFVGIIGLGPEFTGGQYGHDDFDLLTALGSQTASALLAVRMAEELAHTREQQAWDRLSAFVLHDIKNSATMLSLLQENAPANIHKPEFQQDMLELVDDALRRMARVEQRLGSLREEIAPNFREIDLKTFLEGFVQRMQVKLPDLNIRLEGPGEVTLQSDPELLHGIFENLLLNAYEAQGKGGGVLIRYFRDRKNEQVGVEILDNGPGIPQDLLPEGLFEPFKTSKEGGSGIGLWQAKRVAASLGASISAENRTEGGACFILSFRQREGGK